MSGGRASSPTNLEPLWVRRREAQRLLGLGRSRIDQLIADGSLESFKDGDGLTSPRLISYQSLKNYRGRKPRATMEQAAVAE